MFNKNFVSTKKLISFIAFWWVFISILVVDIAFSLPKNNNENKVLSTNTESTRNLYRMTVMVIPDNAGVVNIVPAKELFDQDEIVQLIALPNDINGNLNGNVHIEAETGIMNGNFAAGYDLTASSNFYIYGTTGGPRDGSSKYSFTISEPGDYYIWGRCYALTPHEDSFFMLVDGGTDTLTWHLSNNYDNWVWQRVSHNQVVQQFSFDVGTHEIIVIKRDLNARLDKMIITRDVNFQPQGKEELPTEEFSYKFDYWGGDLFGFDNPMEVTMDSDKNGIAYFYIDAEEVVNIPSVPAGPVSGDVGESLTFTTGGSFSNFRDPVEYQFDWGDEQQIIWDDSTDVHIYEHVGNYQIKARARCQIHNNVVSGWSDDHEVEIFGATNIFQLNITVSPENAGNVFVNPAKDLYDQDEIVQLSAISYGVNGELNGNIYIEAETGLLDGNFYVGSDTAASTGFYIFGDGGEAKDGVAEYTFEITEAGDYAIWGRCYALGSSEDSFLMLINGGIDTLTWHLDENFYNEWNWQKVSHNQIEQVFSLEAGVHTIFIIKRDQKTRLDKMILSKDTAFEPVGKEEFLQQESILFDHWSGDLSGSDNPAELLMDSDKNITAHFAFSSEEEITTPSTPTGPDSGFVDEILSFTTGGSNSNHGFDVEYQFDWGDGSTSDWGGTNQEHSYSSLDTFYLKSRARSQSEAGTISNWSDSHQIIIVEEPIIYHSLSVFIEPVGKGSVVILPDNIEYAHGDTVSLFPVPIDKHNFANWSGDLSGADDPGKIVMDSDKSIIAHFVEIAEFVSTPTTPTGADSGLIGQSLSFSTGGSTCNYGHDVKYQFDWGDGTLSDWGNNNRQHIFSSNNTFKIKARARCIVNANIISDWSADHSTRIIQSYYYTITILVDPQNAGTVNKTPPKSEYENGETVILSPLAASGYIFDHWSGDITGNEYPAIITMDSNKNITAHFRFPTAAERKQNRKPDKFTLLQNFPNPFNPETTISYQLPENCYVILVIFNMTGQIINNLVDEFKQAGFYSIRWNAKDALNNFVPSGVYLYQISTEKFKQMNKMILLK